MSHSGGGQWDLLKNDEIILYCLKVGQIYVYGLLRAHLCEEYIMADF